MPFNLGYFIIFVQQTNRVSCISLDFVTDVWHLLDMRSKQYRFTVKDLCSCLQWNKYQVYRAIKKGYFDPNDLWSVYCKIAEEHRVREMDLKAKESV